MHMRTWDLALQQAPAAVVARVFQGHTQRLGLAPRFKQRLLQPRHVFIQHGYLGHNLCTTADTHTAKEQLIMKSSCRMLMFHAGLLPKASNIAPRMPITGVDSLAPMHLTFIVAAMERSSSATSNRRMRSSSSRCLRSSTPP